MINEKMYGLGDEPSAIRELFALSLIHIFDYFPNRVEDPTLVRPEMWK